MKAFKGYLKSGGPSTAPQTRPEVVEISTLSPSRASHNRWTQRSHSSYGNSILRDASEIKAMKTEVMTEWLYKQQRLKLWASSGPEEGIILKRGRGEYTCCPENLQEAKGGLYDQVVLMNVRVCAPSLLPMLHD
jgi:hypothetical protein